MAKPMKTLELHYLMIQFLIWSLFKGKAVMVPNTTKFHYILACIATAMLFGMVGGHFRVGRELYVWPGQPRPWQIYPLDQDSPGQRPSSEWFQRSKEENTSKGNTAQQR